MGSIICIALSLYLVAIFARIILSWFPIGSSSPIAPINSFLFAITEPLLGPVRRAIPPIRLGAMGLDLSPMIVLFGISIIRSFIC